MNIPISDILMVVNNASVVLFLIIATYAGYRGVWVWGYLYKAQGAELDRERKINEEWQQAAIRGTSLARTALSEMQK